MKNSQNDSPVSEAFVTVTLGTEIVAESVAVDSDGYVSIQVFQESIHSILIQFCWVLLTWRVSDMDKQ